MGLSIIQSVGVDGINQRTDVKLIQVLLNTFTVWKSPFTSLKVDGAIGTDTTNAIKKFQREAAGIKNPDGRIDPNGKTFRYLTLYIIKPEQQAMVQKQAREGRMMTGAPVVNKKTIDKNAGLKGQTVQYHSSLKADKHIVSEYSMQVIKMALKESGTNTGVITDTIRTMEEQAAIMLKNAKKNLQDQKDLYGEVGDAVLAVYEKNMSDKSITDSAMQKLMVAEMEVWEKEVPPRRVSLHVVSKDVYSKRNIIDIGLNSMTQANPGFDQQKFNAALKKLLDEGYLEVLEDETELSNKCWHIEIVVNKKALAKYEENTILNVVAWC